MRGPIVAVLALLAFAAPARADDTAVVGLEMCCYKWGKPMTAPITYNFVNFSNDALEVIVDTAGIMGSTNTIPSFGSITIANVTPPAGTISFAFKGQNPEPFGLNVRAVKGGWKSETYSVTYVNLAPGPDWFNDGKWHWGRYATSRMSWNPDLGVITIVAQHHTASLYSVDCGANVFVAIYDTDPGYKFWHSDSVFAQNGDCRYP